MIGNDLVDLNQAEKESNWQRKGYLNKIYTNAEQEIIFQSKEPSQMVWLLWSMKEAAYKIHSRETNTRSFSPITLVCSKIKITNNYNTGIVCIDNKIYYTKSFLSNSYIHTLAACSLFTLSKIRELIYQNPPSSFNYRLTNPKCVSHHGEYLALVY